MIRWPLIIGYPAYSTIRTANIIRQDEAAWLTKLRMGQTNHPILKIPDWLRGHIFLTIVVRKISLSSHAFAAGQFGFGGVLGVVRRGSLAILAILPTLVCVVSLRILAIHRQHSSPALTNDSCIILHRFYQFT